MFKSLNKRDLFVGLLSGVFMAGVVYGINFDDPQAHIAAWKQFFYTALASVVVIKSTESLTAALDLKRVKFPVFWGALPVIVLTICCSYGLHLLRGTAYPLWSLLPTAILSPPALWWFAWKSCKK